jgi:hypothetical protein
MRRNPVRSHQSLSCPGALSCPVRRRDAYRHRRITDPVLSHSRCMVAVLSLSALHCPPVAVFPPDLSLWTFVISAPRWACRAAACSLSPRGLPILRHAYGAGCPRLSLGIMVDQGRLPQPWAERLWVISHFIYGVALGPSHPAPPYFSNGMVDSGRYIMEIQHMQSLKVTVTQQGVQTR